MNHNSVSSKAAKVGQPTYLPPPNYPPYLPTFFCSCSSSSFFSLSTPSLSFFFFPPFSLSSFISFFYWCSFFFFHFPVVILECVQNFARSLMFLDGVGSILSITFSEIEMDNDHSLEPIRLFISSMRCRTLKSQTIESDIFQENRGNHKMP